MNKIKIINQEMLHLMQSTAKQFRTGDEARKSGFQFSRRPKTPQEVFKSVLRDGASYDMHQRQKERIKTADMFGGTSTGMKMRGTGSKFRPQSPHVIERKIQLLQSPNSRPNTAYNYRRGLKIKTEKHNEKQESMKELKQDIDSVLKQIRQDRQLCQKRMKARYTEYGKKKFGKFWNIHSVNLGKKSMPTNYSWQQRNIDAYPKQSTLKITQL